MMITDYKSFDEMPMFISIPQAAVVLGISNPCLYGIIKRDPTFPVLSLGRRRVVPTSNLKQWIDDQVKKGV
ncbi:MAG: helix-turn-helix domain-containing protein, partial [Clostridiales bacterium]|nr:helix-turn-helix domain-containing protein [Clostridiales bacterium]